MAKQPVLGPRACHAGSMRNQGHLYNTRLIALIARDAPILPVCAVCGSYNSAAMRRSSSSLKERSLAENAHL
eukprot:6213631-Pleurochrysis_carterae.AAC.2